MHDDVYEHLPPDLVAALRDPRTVLPGEGAVYERVYQWTITPVMATPVEATGGAWIEVRSGRSLTGSSVARVTW